MSSSKSSKSSSWTYGAKAYSASYDPSESPYAGKCQRERRLDWLGFYSTVDDPVMKSIAEQIDSQLPDYADDAFAASVALAMVQQNITYAFDEEVYGVPDLWGLPIVVLENRRGDCDCMTDLYVSVAYNLGLDVISLVTDNHMFAAVCVPWGGVYYKVGSKRYYHAEATDRVPVPGRYWSDADVEGYAPPRVPSSGFRETLSPLRRPFLHQRQL